MPSKILWSALSSPATCLNNEATVPTLKALASDTLVLGAEIVNAANKEQLGDFELLIRCAVLPTGAPYVEVFIVEALDGTNYEDGDVALRPARPASFVIPVRAVTTQQRIALTGIQLPPAKFKVLVVNKTGQALTNTNGENGLTLRTYSPEAQ